MNKNIFDKYERVIEVLRKKEKNSLSKVIDFFTGGLLSTADSVVSGGKRSYFLAKKGDNVYLLVVINDITTKSEVLEITDFNNFSKVTHNGYVYKKYKVVKWK